MAIREGVFEVVVFGLVFATPLLDRYLVSGHRYLHGASTAALWAFFSYLSMWEICRRSPLRRFRSLESLATALAASTVGLIFCLRGHDSPLVVLVLSIGLMMGALMAAIAVVACFLDWKLSTGEWVFAGCWCVASVAGIAFLILGRSPAALAASTTQSLTLLTPGVQEQAMLMAGTLLGVLLLLLVVKEPQRLIPTLGLAFTIGLALLWGVLCSQPVLLASQAPVLPWMLIVAVGGLLAWSAWREALPADESVPVEPPGCQPSFVWVGPFGLTLYRIFDYPRVTAPLAASVSPAVSDEATAGFTGNAGEPGVSPEPAVPADAEPVAVAEALGTALPPEPAPTPPAPPPEPMGSPRPLLALIFPPRLTERLVPAVVIAAILNFIR